VPGFEPRSEFDSEDPRIDSSSFLEPESETSFVEPESVFDSEDPRIDSSSFLEPESETPFVEPESVFDSEDPRIHLGGKLQLINVIDSCCRGRNRLLARPHFSILISWLY